MPDDVSVPESASATPAGSSVEVSSPAPEPLPDAPRPAQPLPATRKTAGPLAAVATDRILEDDTFRLLPVGDVDALAKSMARLGQLFPIELRLRRPNRYQVVAGFRRVAAARVLQRPRMLARVHLDLSDEDALLMALSDVHPQTPSDVEQLRATRDRLSRDGRLFPAAAEMLDQAIESASTPVGGSPTASEAPRSSAENGPAGGSGDEVELDALCSEVMARLSAINQDLASIAEMWADVDPSVRRQLIEQLRYPGDLASYLETLK